MPVLSERGQWEVCVHFEPFSIFLPSECTHGPSLCLPAGPPTPPCSCASSSSSGFLPVSPAASRSPRPLHRRLPGLESSFPSSLPAWFLQVPSNTTLLGPGLSSLSSTMFSVAHIAICHLEQGFSKLLGCRMDFSKCPVHYGSSLLQNILKMDY